MADTTFVDNSTVIVASWLNDVNNTVYTGLGGEQTASGIRTHLGLGTAALTNTGTSAGNTVVLDGTAKLPAVDGSQLTNITASIVDVTSATGTLPVLHGGTDATTASGARTNLGSTTVGDAVFTAATVAAAQQAMDVEVGVDVQAYDADTVKAGGLQSQTYTAFTTGGSSTAYTLTPSPAITANTANQRFRVKFNAAAGATPTLAISAQTAKSLKYYDSTGTKQAVTSTQIPLNWVSDVEYDGTDFVVLNVPPASSGGITLGTPVASTSGTSIDFTGIPSGKKRIIINFAGVSTNGSSKVIVQLGDSGGFENTGYSGAVTFAETSIAATNFSSGFIVDETANAAGVRHGTITLNLLSAAAFTWACTSAIGRSDSASVCVGGGSKSLSAELTQVRITTVAGADTFDAGSINIQYE